MQTLDARRMERYSLEVPALLSMVDEGGMRDPFVVMTKNVCSGGAFCITDRPMSLGASVKMDMVLPIEKGNKLRERKTHIDVSGSIIRTEGHGIAICFNKDYKISPVIH